MGELGAAAHPYLRDTVMLLENSFTYLNQIYVAVHLTKSN